MTCSLLTVTDRLKKNYSIDDFCPLPDPHVGLTVLVVVCDVEHTSFILVCAGSRFLLCLFGEYTGLGTIRHSW